MPLDELIEKQKKNFLDTKDISDIMRDIEDVSSKVKKCKRPSKINILKYQITNMKEDAQQLKNRIICQIYEKIKYRTIYKIYQKTKRIFRRGN